METDLAGRVVLVTGASGGIGGEVVRAFVREGARVVAHHHRNAGRAHDLARELGPACVPLGADLTSEREVERLFAEAESRLGPVQVLVANAGVWPPQEVPLEEMTLAQWNTVIGVNLTGQFLCGREAVREFKRRGVVKDVSVSAGKIICISSVHEIIPWSGHVNYAASKGGVMLMMKSIAQEVAPYRIRVNSICPGAIRTPINTSAWSTPEAYDSLMMLIPYKRIGEPDDIGRVAVFLASDQADYINGASVFVDGGMTLYPGFATGG